MTVTADRPTTSAADRQEATLVVEGMTCGACAARIERRLNRLDGVSARVNLAAGRAHVVLDEVPVDRVLEEVEAAGYRARTLPSGSESPAGEDADLVAARSLGRRLVVSAALFMPLCDLSLALWLVPTLRFPAWQWVLCALAAPVVGWAAWPFYVAAARAARHRTTTMETLAAIGILASTGWSLYAMFSRDTARSPQSLLGALAHGGGGAIYLDVAAGVTTFLLAGRYYEAVARRRAGSARRALAGVAAREVSVLDDAGAERRLPLAALRVGDRFVVRPGETVATDGVVVSGEAGLDRSAMTGESLPVDVAGGDRVSGGTIAVGGSLVVRATAVGEATQLAAMVRLVERAEDEKAAAQRLADRVAGVFVPLVLLAALATFAGWSLAGASSGTAFAAALSVVIIACPCALGLATPAALVVAAGQGAGAGIFFKGHGTLERSRHVDTVVLDKTGTLTAGRMKVVDVATAPGVDVRELLSSAGSLERCSEHPIARAVVDRCRAEGIALHPVAGFRAEAGTGVSGTVDGRSVTIGTADPRDEEVPRELASRIAAWKEEGMAVLSISRDGVPAGAMAVADTPRATAPAALAALRDLGLDCVLLSGDHGAAARAVGRSLGIREVVSDTPPSEKAEFVRGLQATGRSVAFVGDGVNDAPALAAADLGIALGSGTDVAVAAADVVIVRDDLRAVAAAVELARRTLRTIRSNLAWAFCYNLLAVPVAALGLLDPLVAAAAMAASSGFVVWNSSRLGHWPAAGARAPRSASAASAIAAVPGVSPRPAGAVAVQAGGPAGRPAEPEPTIAAAG